MDHIVETKLSPDVSRTIPLVDLLCKGTNIIEVGISEIDVITDKIVKAIS